TMEKFSVRRLGQLSIALALALGSFSACQKKSEPAAPATPKPSAAPKFEAARPITGPMTPALVSQDSDSITHYLHYPKDPEAAKLDGAVQFYCDITENGIVETTHALVANHEAFRAAVRTALDWGRFTPATVNGQPVRVYLGGTVLFLHQNGQPVIVVSLATHDRDRVGKLANYIQPQLVGGLRYALQKEISSLTQGVLVSGKAEVVVSVNANRAVTGTSGISENPKDSGLGILLDNAMKKAQFTSAYENGKQAAGGINVVANFAQF
ncbi:MAG: energy transducer TonB, partial [Spartobacteria bacterium]